MTDLVKRETQAVEIPAASNMLRLIAEAARDPNIDVTKMERLFAMHKELAAEQRRESFDIALAGVQSQLPQFGKTSKAKNSMYASLEDIDRITKPLLTAAGFSQTCTEESSTETTATFVFTLSREGHEKSVRKTFSIDRAAKNREGNSIRPAIQDDGSTISYATRYLLKMILGIVEKDADTNGESAELITDEQAKTIDTLIQDTKSNKASFLKLIAGTERVEDIQQRDYKRVINALETKLRTNQK